MSIWIKLKIMIKMMIQHLKVTMKKKSKKKRNKEKFHKHKIKKVTGMSPKMAMKFETQTKIREWHKHLPIGLLRNSNFNKMRTTIKKKIVIMNQMVEIK